MPVPISAPTFSALLEALWTASEAPSTPLIIQINIKTLNPINDHLTNFPKNVLSETSQINSTYTQPSKSVINTLPETKITKLTSQMIENCKIITDEYNKLKEGNQ